MQGQIKFEKGYIVENDGQKKECFIKNYDWEKNPVEIEYRENDSLEIQKGKIKFIKEFGINGVSRYIRADVLIDRSPMELDHLSENKNPDWRKEQLFLKLLVKGKASLYHYYSDPNLTRFFYSTSADQPERDETKNTGKLYRVWMDFKAAVTSKDRKAILSSCEFGEDVAKKHYEEACMHSEGIAPDAMELIKKQKAAVLRGHDTVKSLRDAAK